MPSASGKLDGRVKPAHGEIWVRDAFAVTDMTQIVVKRNAESEVLLFDPAQSSAKITMAGLDPAIQLTCSILPTENLNRSRAGATNV
jgi:hypothetical protein